VTAPRTEPPIIDVKDDAAALADAPAGMHFYFDLSPHCRRWAATFEIAIRLRTRCMEQQDTDDATQARSAIPRARPGRGRPRTLTNDQINEIARLFKEARRLGIRERQRAGMSYRVIGQQFHISGEMVSQIGTGRKFSDVTGISRNGTD